MTDSVLRDQLVQLLEGGQAHVSVEKALSGVEVRLRNVRPHPSLHSVWEELVHMRIAQEDILRYTLDDSWQSPEWPGGYWPEPGRNPTEAMWSQTISAFHADLKEATALVRDPVLDLTARIPHGQGRTYLRQVLLIADHNAYHLGQIVQVRKWLSNWPD